MDGTKRNSVDLQNWATYRHQQTVEQLQKLKVGEPDFVVLGRNHYIQEETFGKSQKECEYIRFV